MQKNWPNEKTSRRSKDHPGSPSVGGNSDYTKTMLKGKVTFLLINSSDRFAEQ
jgi:hypothetical protein